MRAPRVAPSVGLQPERAPGYVAPRTVPQENPAATQLKQVGAAVEDVGRSEMRTAEILAERLDVARAKDADAKLADGFRKLLLSPTGYRNRLGEAAVDSYAQTLKDLDAHRQKVLGSLTPRQRELISGSDSSRYQQARASIDGHYVEQLDAYAIGRSEARAEALQVDAVNNYFSGQDPKPSIQGVLGELQSVAQRRGLSREKTQQLLTAARDNVHGAIIDRLANEGRATQALQYLDAHKDEISATKQGDLGKGLAVAATKEMGVKFARGVAQPGVSLPEQVKTLEQLLLAPQPAAGVPINLGVADREGVFLTALQEVTRVDKALAAEKARMQSDAWDEIERHAQLTGGVLDAAHEDLIDAADLRDRFKLWTRQGKQFTTSEFGHQALTEWTPQELRQRYPTREALLKAYKTELSREGLGQLLSRWDSGAEELPKLDRGIVFADGLREALRLPKKAPIDKDLFDRWSNSVLDEVRRLMLAKPGTPAEAHWGEAMKLAGARGHYLTADPQGKRMLDIQTEAGDYESGNVFVQRDDAMLEAQLTKLDPESGLTFREAANKMLDEQAQIDRPDKPKGFVRTRRGVVPRASIGLSDVANVALDLQQKSDDARKNIGRAWLRDAFTQEFRDAAQQLRGGERIGTTGVAAPSRVTMDAITREAVRRLMERRAEWSHLHLALEDIWRAAGLDPAAERTDYESRRNAGATVRGGNPMLR